MIAKNAFDLGSLLREARQHKGMTQAELADLLGVSRQWVVSAEKGAPTAQVELVMRALRCVDLLIDIVQDDTPPPPAHNVPFPTQMSSKR